MRVVWAGLDIQRCTFRRMKTNVWLAWLAVVAVLVIGLLLRFLVQPSNWVLYAVLTLACLPIGYLLGGSDKSTPETPDEPAE